MSRAEQRPGAAVSRRARREDRRQGGLVGRGRPRRAWIRSPRPTTRTTRSCTSRRAALAEAAADRRGRRRGRVAAVAAGRRAAGAQGRVHHDRHADHVRIEDPRGLDPAVRRHRHRAAARGGHPDPRQDQHGRVRDGLAPPRTPPTARPATRGTSTGSPAARAAAARRRWPRSRRRWPSAPTPAGRSASPRR